MLPFQDIAVAAGTVNTTSMAKSPRPANTACPVVKDTFRTFPIVKHQQPRNSGAKTGSWDPVGPWGPDGGRVYSTATMVMCLEVYYRYPRVVGLSRGKRNR